MSFHWMILLGSYFFFFFATLCLCHGSGLFSSCGARTIEYVGSVVVMRGLLYLWHAGLVACFLWDLSSLTRD